MTAVPLQPTIVWPLFPFILQRAHNNPHSHVHASVRVMTRGGAYQAALEPQPCYANPYASNNYGITAGDLSRATVLILTPTPHEAYATHLHCGRNHLHPPPQSPRSSVDGIDASSFARGNEESGHHVSLLWSMWHPRSTHKRSSTISPAGAPSCSPSYIAHDSIFEKIVKQTLGGNYGGATTTLPTLLVGLGSAGPSRRNRSNRYFAVITY